MSKTVQLPEWPLKQVRALASQRGVQVWPVGGVVRDALLERSTHDWDFAVEGDAQGLARAVGDAVGGAYYPLDKERDVGRVLVPQTDGPRLVLDFAALRGPSLVTDLDGRDFTINAMAVDPEGQLVDPHNGGRDLQEKLLRAVGPWAFDDDPLRMLRAVRLKAELGLRLEVKTANWIIQRAHTLSNVSAERVRDELVRTLASPAPADHTHLLDELQLLTHIIPEIEALKEQAQSSPHRHDVWWHTLMTLEGVDMVIGALTDTLPEPAYVDAPQKVWQEIATALSQYASRVRAHLKERTPVPLLLAALFHDLGKPLTCTEDDQGRLHFYSHEIEGARLACERMEQLRFSRTEVDQVQIMVRSHMRPAHLARTEGQVSRRAIYRYFRATGKAGVETVLLSLADHLSIWGPNLEQERWSQLLETAGLLLRHWYEHVSETIAPIPLISGRDLMDELELEAGPQLGQLLEAVEEAQAAGEVQTREQALELVRRLSDQTRRQAD